MPRTKAEIYADLDAAYARDRELKIGTPEYKQNRQAIGILIDEYHTSYPVRPAAFTESDYNDFPDSFEQSALNRTERERRAAETQRWLRGLAKAPAMAQTLEAKLLQDYYEDDFGVRGLL